MTTSGAGVVFLICFFAVVVAAVWSVAPLLGDRLSLRGLARPALVLWLVVAIPSALLLALPELSAALTRSSSAVLDQGQWWRVVTALVVQDGGLAGTASNLIVLGVALVVCCPLWGTWATILIFVLGGLVLDVAAVLIGAQDGGGNSLATIALLSTLPILALATGTRSRPRLLVVVALMALAGVALILARDFHGFAVGFGLVLGAAGIPLVRLRSQRGLLAPVTEST